MNRKKVGNPTSVRTKSVVVIKELSMYILQVRVNFCCTRTALNSGGRDGRCQQMNTWEVSQRLKGEIMCVLKDEVEASTSVPTHGAFCCSWGFNPPFIL